MKQNWTDKDENILVLKISEQQNKMKPTVYS